VTLDGKTGLVYEGNLLQRIHANHKIVPVKEKMLGASAVKKTTASRVYLVLDEISSALPDLDGVEGLIVTAEYLWCKIDTHPEYMKEHKKLHLITDELIEKLTHVCLANSNLKIIFRTTSWTRQQLMSMKFGKAYEVSVARKEIDPNEYIYQPVMFDSEIEAVKKVRHKNRITNLSIEINGARDLGSLMEMKKHLSGKGLIRSSSFKLWVDVATPQMIDYIEDLDTLGVDGLVIRVGNLLKLYTGKNDWQPNQKIVKWLMHIIEISKKTKLPHLFEVNSKWEVGDLKELLTQGLTNVSLDLMEEEPCRERLWQAEQLMMKRN